MSNDPLMHFKPRLRRGALRELPRDPGSVSAEWQATFQAMPDDPLRRTPPLSPPLRRRVFSIRQATVNQSMPLIQMDLPMVTATAQCAPMHPAPVRPRAMF